MASFSERMIGAAMLNVNTYEEVEADTNAMPQAVAVVVLSSLAAGIGAFRLGGISGVIGGTVSALIGWVIWSGLAFLIGTKVLPEPTTRSDVGELLRTTGFAQSVGIARVLGIIPVLGWFINIAASLWLLVTMVVAVRQALDYKSTGRAIGVCLIGFVVYIVVGVVIGTVFGTATLVTGGFS